MRLQSAMEYLMTYGWAILIIAVVLIGLNYLGIFNSETFAPKASPGACYVLRTAAQVSLAGECNGYIPRSVGQFNGQGYINVGNPSSLQITSAITMSAWVYAGASQNTANPSIFDKGGNYGSGGGGYGIALRSLGSGHTQPYGVYCFLWASVDYEHSSGQISSGWNMVTCTYDGSHLNIYINGTQDSTYSVTGAIPQENFNSIIGGDSTPSGPQEKIIGSLSNIQIYNTSLSASTIQSMYAEGIGGAPIQLQNLAGWWPLNGNTYDYSGNGNNGANSNVYFNPSWYTSYVPA